MAIYELQQERIFKLPSVGFGISGIKERADLQRLLRTQLDVVCPDTLILSEEFGNWQESRRRIDLLGLDKDANLVVIELKRTEDGGHMELQAIRYAAMVSNLTFEQAVEARKRFQASNGIEKDAEETLLGFLGWEEPEESSFGQSVRIVLVSAEFSKELTTSVLWLNNFDMDIRCVRLRPYQLNDHLLLDVQQVVPLPEAAEYQIQVREKSQKERKSREGGPDWTRYDIRIGETTHKRLYKRRAILLLATTLVENGISPDQIAALIPWRGNRIWLAVDGELDADQFQEKANEDAKRDGKNFDPRRWFCDNGELMRFGGKTYAFSNQWGTHTPKAMKILANEYPEMRLSVEPSPDESE